MKLRYTLSFFARFFSAFAAPYDPTITALAKLTPRQTDPGFVGYTNVPGLGYSPYSCATTETWSTLGLYANCCPTSGNCILPTACAGRSTIINQFGLDTCGGEFTCATATILNSISDKAPIWWIQCWNTVGVGNLASLSFIRTLASTITPVLTSIPTSTSSSLPTSTPVPPTRRSKAWIAGAVVSPILAVTILVLAFWIYRLRNGKATAGQPKLQQYQSLSQEPISLQQKVPPPQQALLGELSAEYSPERDSVERSQAAELPTSQVR